MPQLGPREEGGRDLTASSRVPLMGVRWFIVVGAGIMVADPPFSESTHEGSRGTIRWDIWRRGIEGGGSRLTSLVVWHRRCSLGFQKKEGNG